MKFKSATFSCLAFLCFLSANAGAQTVTVTTASDAIDINTQTGTVADLPGPDGKVSFSEAMIATNNTPGHQTVAFNIPQNEWILQFILPGRAVLTSTVGFYYRAFDSVTIDGTTQTAFTGDTNPDGNEVAIYGATLYLNADNCTLIGFDSTSVSLTEDNGLIEGNTGTMQIELFNGSGSTVRGNTGGTVKIDRSSNNLIVGNTISRVRVLGWIGGGLPATGNRIGGPALADRNFITGYGTYNSEGYPSGTTVQLFDSIGTQIENNWIGTTTDGLAQGNLASTAGIGFEGENHNTSIRDNRIAGILGHGIGPHAAGLLFGWSILIGGSGSGIEIVGNTIGLDANDQPLLGSVWGVDIGDATFSTVTDIRIGSSQASEGNAIAGHILNGINVARNAQGVRIQGNSIFENGWRGIDLIPTSFGYGVTPNDPLDADTGGNGLQNFPVLESASPLGAMTRILGSLHSSPSSTFTLEFFASPSCDDSGFGEGRMYLGSSPAVTNAAGNFEFNLVLPISLPAGWVVTSTATSEPSGATSEFSACVALIDSEVGLAFCFGDGSGTACPCGNSGASGQGCASSASATGARLLATGTVSVATDDLVLQALDSVPLAPGLFFQGDSAVGGGFGLPFGDGLRCAGGNIVRLQVAIAGPGGLASSTVDIAARGGVSAAETQYYQWWYRDSMSSPCGGLFNLSNAVELVWAP